MKLVRLSGDLLGHKSRALARGSSTLEILIAFAILTLALTAVILVFSSNQDVAVDTETASEALGLAQAELEEARATSREDFFSLTDSSSVETSGPLDYNRSLQIVDISPCFKHATSTVTWDNGRPQAVRLSTYLSDVLGAIALGGGCDSTPPGDWTNPTSYGSSPPSVVDGQGTGIAVANIGGVRYAFITTENNDPAKNDIWSFDVSDPQGEHPVLDQLNIASSSNAIAIARDFASGKTYAYVASINQNKDISCPPGADQKWPFDKQLQTLDVSDPTDVQLEDSDTLPTIDGCGSFPAGVSIYYYDGKVYVGTKETGGDELTIFDAETNPANPAELDSINVNRNVNAIIVRNGLAYLATGSGISQNPLQIYDVNPSSPTYLQEVVDIADRFTATGDEQGTSLYLIGNKLYLGLESTPSSRPDFYVVDVSDPTKPTAIGPGWRACDKSTPQKCLKTSIGSSHPYISGIAVRSHLAFFTTTDPNMPFWVVEISDASNIKPFSTCVPYDVPQETRGLVFLDNYAFIVDRSNAAFQVIYPDPDPESCVIL